MEDREHLSPALVPTTPSRGEGDDCAAEISGGEKSEDDDDDEHELRMVRDGGRVRFRPYQRAVFEDHSSGIVVLHWSRQIGKSYVLAAWAVCRLLDHPGRLVTVLSNSRENGAEFLQKCAEICALNGTRFATMMKPPRRRYGGTSPGPRPHSCVARRG